MYIFTCWIFTKFGGKTFIYGGSAPLLATGLCSVKLMEQMSLKHDAFRPLHQVAAPELKSAVSDCILLLIKDIQLIITVVV